MVASMLNMTTCGVGLVITSIFCVRSLGFEVCYGRSNSSGHVTRLTCVGACCDSGSDKYCCGALLEDEQAEDENEYMFNPLPAEGNQRCTIEQYFSLIQQYREKTLDTEVDVKAIGTISAGIAVFLALVVAVVACCVCKPSCGQVEPEIQHTPQTVPQHFSHSITMTNPVYTSGALKPGYPTYNTHQYT